MISVAEALERITGGLRPVAGETVTLAEGLGRVLAEDVVARVTQPPVAVSAMDGYAVRATDVTEVPVTLKRIGEAPAGTAFEGSVGSGEAVRIFTGAPVPDGADAIVIQEDVDAEGDSVHVREGASEGRYIRPAGLDFSAGDLGIPSGRILSARDVGLAAAMDVPWLSVRRRPRVALLATGDEIVRPGEPRGPHQIVSSNALALAALVAASGGEAIDLGIAADDEQSLTAMAAGARGADILVTIGGASVGDRDLVRAVLGEQGLEIDFWRIAMRPGKPLMFGSIGATAMLGLPGNPVSALVCGLIFLRPALYKMLAVADSEIPHATARLGCNVPENDRRQDYLRAKLSRGDDGSLVADPFALQDSSMLSRLAQAGCLVVRPPHAPAAKAGEIVEIIPFEPGLAGF
jgi:molybdopterin molybdotransferase